MFLNSEKNLLNVIRFGPVLPLLILSLIITLTLVNETKNDLSYGIKTIKDEYFKENKIIVKNEITKIVDLINSEIIKSEESLKKQIKSRVYEAYDVATNIYNKAKSEEISEKQTFELIKLALTGMSHKDSRGYFFMDDINGIKLLQPFNESFVGKNFLEFKDANGYEFIKKRIKVIKNKSESFDEYYWYKPNDTKNLYKKISFYKYFEPYNISIGTGEYSKDFEERLKKKVLSWLDRIKSNTGRYIFVYKLDGTCLLHAKKEYIGLNRIDLKDKNGKFILKDMLSFLKENKKGYVNYFSSYNSNNYESTDKISYIQLLEKWGWMIGTGFYLDKLNKEIKVREKELIESNDILINKILFISVIITILLVLISFYISDNIAKKFNNYKKELKQESDKILEKERLLIQHSKMAMMGEMIGNIAHQWKQPLSVIKMSNSLIKMGREDENFSSKEQMDRALSNIDNSVVYLSDTIDDFKNFFNPNKLITEFSIENIFDKTFKLISSEFKNCNIEIIKNIKDIKINGYQNELLQVLINIIKNAKDEFNKKEDSKKHYLFIDVYQEDNNVIIKIKDNAGGIEKDIIQNIFDAYFTCKEEHEGTGIGLHMSKKIIEENMHGSLEANNIEYEFEDIIYKGAQFTITLPLS